MYTSVKVEKCVLLILHSNLGISCFDSLEDKEDDYAFIFGYWAIKQLMIFLIAELLP